MGQAWCKEKSTKAQDSKSPLDRVFVRCAHRIYPSLKEEGSVLGGATQRVTSSEIGYAGSPPREVLTRGRSIDSVDRPFHPSDWVDVNLEVPSTPRPCSVLTNLTVDTNLYPTTTPTSSCSNLKDATPIPPPRRRKRNKGRPLPPKPDEIVAENLPNGLKRPKSSEEPLYSSVKSPKSSGDEQDAEEETRLDKHRSQEDGVRDGRRPKEIYEHKVNGTGKVISSDVVSGKRTCENVQQQQRKTHENEEYDRFARSRTTKDSSTPNRVDKSRSKEIEKQIKDSSRDAANSSGNARTKNYSTVSLPNYDELDVARYRTKENVDHEHQQEETRKSRRPVRSSTGSLPAESFLSPFSEKTSVRLEDYIPRSDNLSPYQVLEKLDCGANARMAGDDFVKYDPSKSEDWELGDVGNCELNHRRRLSFEDTSKINDERRAHDDKDEDVVDFSTGRGDERRSSLDQDASRSSVHLQKPESFGKTPSPVVGEPEYTEVDPNRTHLKYFNPPTLDKSCGISCVEETSETEEPFFLDEAKHRSALDTIRGSATVHPESDRSDRSKMTFARSLSNESEPNDDAYESKELSSRTAGLIRTISEESLPREMLEEHALDDFFDEKLAKDVHNKLKKSLDEWKTSTPPPPSPEPKIKPQIQDSDHSTLLKVLKEDAAEGSNLSSMTPSLNELEAALSDMLEKEDTQDGPKEDGRTNGGSENFTLRVEPAKVFGSADSFNKNETDDEMETVDHQNLVERELREANEAPVSLTRILNDKKPVAGRKVSFCMWEEAMTEMGVQKDGEVIVDSTDLDKVAVLRKNESRGTGNVVSSTEFPPEKPCRLNRSTDELVGNVSGIPTPPRRRNRSLGAVNNKESEIARNGSAVPELVSNDRLI